MSDDDLGPCCACEKEGPDVRNILCLDRKGPVEGKGWGCFSCGLPPNGAVAILCDHCLQVGAEIRFVCTGWPNEGRMPIADLPFEAFEHNLSLHPECVPIEQLRGLYQKYIIQKADGTPVDPEAIYFVLRLDTDPAAREAASAYASACQEANPQLASDLWALVDRIERRTS